MGKAARWFKGLFGIKRQNLNSSSGDEKRNERGGFGHSGRERVAGALCHNPETIPPNLSPAEATWLRSFYKETEEEQSKHAIAVAAATAAAADAAVAAAQAAVAVVRLTSHGRVGGGKRFAAVRIQTVFRGFLARKALRALKGLVKIQALVRGFLVRKQATATLHSMQAMIRAQATVRSQKFRRQMSNDNKNRAQNRARKSLERFDDTRSEHLSSVHSRRLSASLDAAALAAVDESPKIVEVDTGRPKSRSRRTNASVSDFGDDPTSQQLSSPAPSCRHAGRLSIPDCRSYPETEWFLAGPDECRYPTTAQSTPRFNTSSCAPPTPARSVAGDSFFRNHPNYMANTKSFRAKLRSYSAPKQRPEPAAAATKKRMSLSEVMEARSSLSGVKMQRSCSRVQEAINFKNAIMSKLDRSTDFSRETETETERYSVSGNVRT